MPKSVEKVLVYVTRPREELLVFEHVDFLEAGIQVPAGTVEPGETPAMAAWRELREESGLEIPGEGVSLGRFEWLRRDRNEVHFRNVVHFPIASPLPDEWIHVVRGNGEDGGMRFRFFWMNLEQARGVLAVDQGAYLALTAAPPLSL